MNKIPYFLQGNVCYFLSCPVSQFRRSVFFSDMLALRSARLQRRRPFLSCLPTPYTPQNTHARPSNRRSFMQGLGEGFLDLAIALPIPPSLPPYSTTIVLVTVATRLALLPVAIWVCDIRASLQTIQVSFRRRVNDEHAKSKKWSFLKSKNSNLLSQNAS